MIDLDRLAPQFQKALTDEIEKIVEDEAMKARTEVSRRVKARIAEVAASVCSGMAFDSFKNTLIIRVEFKDPKP